MNPEHPAGHSSCLPPGRNLAGIIEVLDFVVAAQRIDKLRDNPRSSALELVRLEVLNFAQCGQSVVVAGILSLLDGGGRNPFIQGILLRGAEGIRTPDPLTASPTTPTPASHSLYPGVARYRYR